MPKKWSLAKTIKPKKTLRDMDIGINLIKAII